MTRKIWKAECLKMKNIIILKLINMETRNVWGVRVLEQFNVKEYKWKGR